jgi:hypothetical protein
VVGDRFSTPFLKMRSVVLAPPRTWNLEQEPWNRICVSYRRNGVPSSVKRVPSSSRSTSP